MMSRSISIPLLVVFYCLPLSAQSIEKKITAEEYIDKYKEGAIKEMLLYNIPASITLAQGMLESANGNSDLAIHANNHFGIKCHNTWTGPTYIKDDDKKDECFRKYPSVLDSYTDHSKFLRSGSRYASLFELKRTDYKSWAKGLKEKGYATDPKYPERLMNLIEKYSLHQYDSEDNSPKSKTTVAQKQKIQQTTQPREILRFHFIKYVIVKPGDTFYKIAQETDKDLWQLYKYNDLSSEDKLQVGEKIYLQPKRRKAKDPIHIVQQGETMRSISQLHGIKLKMLYKKNNMKPGEEPVIGQQLYMRESKK